MKKQTTKTIACVITGLTLSACVGAINVPAGTENKITDGTMDTTMDKATDDSTITPPTIISTTISDRIASVNQVGTLSLGSDLNDASDNIFNAVNSETQGTFNIRNSNSGGVIMTVNGDEYMFSATFPEPNSVVWVNTSNANFYIEGFVNDEHNIREILSGTDENIQGTYLHYSTDTNDYESGATNFTRDFILGFAAVGIQTPVNTVANQTATAIYKGGMELDIFLGRYKTDTSVGSSYRGNLTMNVDFDANTVSGTADLRLRADTTDALVGRATLVSTSIVDNGFQGDFTLDNAALTDVGLTDNPTGNYAGNFFGPNADDLAGVLRISGTSADGILIGHGGFRGDRQTSE